MTILIFSIFIVCFSPVTVQADSGWEANIVVSVLNAENRLSFGERPDATEDFDNRYDVPAMLSGDIEAYFLLNDGTNCWRDIKAAGRTGVKSWDLHIESSLVGEIVKIKWDPELLPHNLIFRLIDYETGTIVDMRRHNSYSYQNNGDRCLRLEVRP